MAAGQVWAQRRRVAEQIRCVFVSYIGLLSKIYIFKKVRWLFLKKKKVLKPLAFNSF